MYLWALIGFSFFFYVGSLYIFGYNKKFNFLERDEVKEKIEKIKGKPIYYSLKIGAYEIIGLLTMTMLFFLHAFHGNLDENTQLGFTIIGMGLFVIAFLRTMVLWNRAMKIDDEFIYIRKGLKEKKYSLSRLSEVELKQYHLLLVLKNPLRHVYIPLGFSNIHVVYKMLIDKVEEMSKKEKREEEYKREETKK